MARNPILDEIYATRELLLAEYNGDVHAYIQDARQRALASGHPIAAPKQRAKRCAGVAEPGVAGTENPLPPAQ